MEAKKMRSKFVAHFMEYFLPTLVTAGLIALMVFAIISVVDNNFGRLHGQNGGIQNERY
jgi:uncharacterized membrane protein (DUF373 family)